MGTSSTRLRIALFAALVLTVAAVTAGCGGSSTAKSGVAGARHATSSVVVKTRKLPKVGTVLVNSKGLTLYMFVRDKRKRVTCTSQACVILWPPLKLKAGQTATAGGAAKKSLLGSDKNPNGGRVVTYNRWPLYTYYRDKKPGQATGQGVNNSGGLWYVLSPTGQVIKK